MLYKFILKFLEEYNLLEIDIFFRGFLVIFTSFIISLTAGPKIISHLRKTQGKGQPIRDDGPQSHIVKQGTPTMGAFILFLSFFVSAFLFLDLSNKYVMILMFTLLVYGVLGFIDDYLKIKKSNTKGVSGKSKLLLQFLIAFVIVFWISKIFTADNFTYLNIPFFKSLSFDMGWLYFIFASIIIVGSSNAVNLTDGLDGLVSGVIIIVSLAIALISYFCTNLEISNYLDVMFIPGSKEVVVLCTAIIGSTIGFLWFNAYPAKVFMGDMGSLAIGALLGVLSIIIKHEVVFAIIGGIFVIEAISVILQVYYYKLTGGKRIFRMAPIHHHFEQKGIPETIVVMRFWIVSLILSLIGISSLIF